jgi:hypothetical protein
VVFVWFFFGDDVGCVVCYDGLFGGFCFFGFVVVFCGG